MTKAPVPIHEAARLEVLREYQILDTEPEFSFDNLTSLAAQVCGAPEARLSFADADRIWCKSPFTDSQPRENSFCAWAIGESEMLLAPDTLKDQRFAEHPLVTGEKGIRFYAAAPLITTSGEVLGALEVFDVQARTLAPEQIQMLRSLSDAVVSLLDLRRQTLAREASGYEQIAEQLRLKEKLLDRVEQRSSELARSNNQLKQQVAECVQLIESLEIREQRYSMAVRSANDGIWDWDLKTHEIYLCPRWKEMLGFAYHEVGNNPDELLSRIHPEDRELFKADLEAILNGWTLQFENEHRMLHRSGEYRWMLSRGLVAREVSGTAYRVVGSITDVTDRK
jgi:PAS domain S-box-containing protein